jgi:HEAT repeat protein
MSDVNREETDFEPEPRSPLEDLADALLEGQPLDYDPRRSVRLDIDEVMRQLTGESDELDPKRLLVFSDLIQADAERVRRDWALIPARRRKAVITYLTAVAEEELGVHLGAILRIALQDSDPEIRRLALEGLWEETTSDLIGPMVQLLLNDENEGVRAAAAQALGRFVLAGELDELDAAFSMRAEEALLSVLLRPEEALEVRRRALESIAFSGEVGVRQLIEDAYYDPDENMRISALTAMGRSADVRWRGLVRAELQNPSPAMRGEAALACGELDARAANRELIALLDDEDQFVRIAAITALGQVGGKEARDALRIVSEGDEPLEAEAAELALEELLFQQDDADIALFDEEAGLESWDEESWDLPYGGDGDDDDDYGEYSA